MATNLGENLFPVCFMRKGSQAEEGKPLLNPSDKFHSDKWKIFIIKIREQRWVKCICVPIMRKDSVRAWARIKNHKSIQTGFSLHVDER